MLVSAFALMLFVSAAPKAHAIEINTFIGCAYDGDSGTWFITDGGIWQCYPTDIAFQNPSGPTGVLNKGNPPPSPVNTATIVNYFNNAFNPSS